MHKKLQMTRMPISVAAEAAAAVVEVAARLVEAVVLSVVVDAGAAVIVTPSACAR